MKVHEILLEDGTVANFDSMIEDLKRKLARGETVKLTVKYSHTSPKHKGKIVSYNFDGDKLIDSE